MRHSCAVVWDLDGPHAAKEIRLDAHVHLRGVSIETIPDELRDRGNRPHEAESLYEVCLNLYAKNGHRLWILVRGPNGARKLKLKYAAKSSDILHRQAGIPRCTDGDLCTNVSRH